MAKKALKAIILSLTLILSLCLMTTCNGSGGGGWVGGGGCTNQCSTSGAKECSGDGYHVCGNYDSDKCLEWSAVTACGAGEACSDGVCSPVCTDADGDGYYAQSGCGTAADCNDHNGTVYPGAPELCDGIDNQCPGDPGYGTVDEGCFQKIGNDVRITNDVSYSYMPSLAWTGSEYGVSWVDDRDNPNISEEIYFARISASGAKIGSDVRITNDANLSRDPSLAWTGSEYGVSWVDDRDGNFQIYFARISTDGTKIGADIRITNDANGSSGPSLAWTGSEYGVSWRDYRDGNDEIYFARISASGTKVGADVRITNDSNWSELPSLVWTGSEYGVSWDDDRDGNYEIYFAHISASGTKIGADVRITNAAYDSSYPSLAWTGSEYGVSWEDLRDDLDGICDLSSGTMDCSYKIYFARIGLVP